MTSNRRLSMVTGAARGFTLVELLIAGVVTAFVLGSISMSLANLARAKDISKMRFAAHLRADTALNLIRQDIVSIIRADDLFFTRFLIYSGWSRTDDMPRDEFLVFNNQTRMIRTLAFTGEGQEYETQYRIEDSEIGPILWQRRDAFPDEYPEGGGIATPLVEGIIGLHIEAYDGLEWWNEWDSDEDGIPLAVRVTITATGARDFDDHMNGPFAILRAVIALDRVPSPLGLESLQSENQETQETDPSQQPAEGDPQLPADGTVIITPDGQIIRPGDTLPPPNTGGGRPRPGTRPVNTSPTTRPNTNRGGTANRPPS